MTNSGTRVSKKKSKSMAVSSILKHSSRENQKDRSGSDLRQAFKHVKIEWVHEFRISKYERSRRDEDAITDTLFSTQ